MTEFGTGAFRLSMLAQYRADERVFLNPFSGRELPKWLTNGDEAARDWGDLVVCFVPAQVGTEWWQCHAAKSSVVRFPVRQVKFAGAESGAPFLVAIVIFRPGL